MSKINPVTCLSITSLKHLVVLLRCSFFSGLHFYTLPKTLIACRDMQLNFLKVKTLLNKAFKISIFVFSVLLEIPSERNITEENSDVFGSILDFLQNSERIESTVDDFITSLPYIIVALCIVGVVSFLFIILMRWLTNVIVIGSIFVLFGLLAWAMYFCYDTWLCYRDREAACNPTSTSAPLMSYQQSETMWLAFAITLSIIAGILFILCLVLAKRFRVAAQLLEKPAQQSA